MTFCGKYTYSVTLRDDSPCLYADWEEEPPEIKIELHDVMYAKAKLERCDSKDKMWVRETYANAMMNYMIDSHGIQYSIFKNYIQQAMSILDISTIESEDFQENPIQPIIGIGYDTVEVSKCVDTELIEHIQWFCFYLTSDRVYNAINKLNEIEMLMSEFSKIKDEKLYKLVEQVISRIGANKHIMYEFMKYLDKMLQQQIRNKYEMTM